MDFYVEKLIRLPDAFFCLSAAGIVPAVGALPMLKCGCVTFASLNNFTKSRRQCWNSGLNLLHLIPGSRLFNVARAQ